MKSKILGLLAVGLLAGPVVANAVVVTVQGDQWDVTAVLMSPTSAVLAQQPWFTGTSALAIEFRDAVGALLGQPNTFFNDPAGPYFAYSTFSTAARIVMLGHPDCDTTGSCSTSGTEYFAVASRFSSVPEPGTLALLGLGLLGLGWTRRKAA